MPAKSASTAVAAKPRKLTPQRRNFARHVAMGYSPTRAYRLCYQVSDDTKPSTVTANAYNLMQITEVKQMVAALQQEASAAAVVTTTSMLNEMGVNRMIALDEGKLSVAATSSRDRAKVAGLLTPKPQVPEHRPDEAAQHVQDGTTAEERSLFEIARRVFFTLELGKRRAKELPAPKRD
jgi:hypothetical protein